MRIHIRGAPTYNRDDVEVPPGLTVAELRSHLAALFDIDSDTHFIRLLIRGRLMQDADPLSSYGVEAGSTVNVVVQARQLGSATGATAGLQQSSQEDGGNSGGGSDMSVGVGGGGFPWESLMAAVASSIASSAQQRSVQPPPTTQPGSPQPPAQYQWSWSFGNDRGGGRGGDRGGGRGGGGGGGWGAGRGAGWGAGRGAGRGVGRGSVQGRWQGCRTPDTTPAPVPPAQDAGSRFSLPSLFSRFFSGPARKGRGDAEAALAAAPPRRTSSCTSTSSSTSSTSSTTSGADEGDARGVQVRVEIGREPRGARAVRKAQRRARRQARRAAKDARRDDQRAAERATEEVQRAAERTQRDAKQRARQVAEEARRCALQAAQEMQQRAWRAAAELRADAGDWRRIVKHAAQDLKTAAGKMSREAGVEWHDEAGLQDAAAPPPAARSAPELEPAASTSTTATTAKTSPPSMDVAIDKAASVQLPPPLFPSPKLPLSPLSEPAPQDSAVQQQPAVVHLHVHCTSDELGDMPLRLRRLADQVPVAQVVLQTEIAEQDGGGPDSQPRTMLRHTTAAAAASTPPTPDTRGAALRPTTATLTAATTASVPWIDEALSTTLATLGMPQLMQLAAGNYNVLASLREPLQAQVQRRLAGTSGSLAAVAHVAHHEAQQLTTRILGMPAVCQFLEREAAAARAAGRTPDEGRQRPASFRAELPRFLEHFYVAIMQHVRRTPLSAAEWSRELRNIFVRHTGMAMTRSVQWFDEGRQAFQPVVANVMLSLLQSSGASQQYPILHTFSSMLGPMLQSLLEEWGREYEQYMQRSEDTITFDQAAAPSSPPQRTSPLSVTSAVTRELQPPPPFAEVVKQTSSLYSDKSLSGGASSLVPPPLPPTTPESDCAQSHLLPAWNARHLFRSTQPQHRNAVDGGASAATATATAAAALATTATTATTPATVTTAGGDLNDLANELMGGYDDGDGDDDEKQPSTRAVSPKTRPLDAPSDTTVPAFSIDTSAGESDAAAAAAEGSCEEAEAEAVAASQARLAAAVEDWEDSCGVPHAVAERLSAMASRYAEARSLASASLRLSTLARTVSAASAPPQPPSVTSITGSVNGSLDGWVTWEANPYGDAPSSG